MKLFVSVIIPVTVIGGFVGAELMDSNALITGAVVGGVGAAAVLMISVLLWRLVFRRKAASLDGPEAPASDIQKRYATPRCPRCRGPMEQKTRRWAVMPRRPRGMFWGCVDYPICRGTRSLDA